MDVALAIVLMVLGFLTGFAGSAFFRKPGVSLWVSTPVWRAQHYLHAPGLPFGGWGWPFALPLLPFFGWTCCGCKPGLAHKNGLHYEGRFWVMTTGKDSTYCYYP
ncbi:hypothetical protein CO608_03685 [Lysobacteraceae bacterium NML08-0793]|nr:hypothetical protein CO608_03685 [Xanthomonadaceae bacterium NML08-0793]